MFLFSWLRARVGGNLRQSSCEETAPPRSLLARTTARSSSGRQRTTTVDSWFDRESFPFGRAGSFAHNTTVRCDYDDRRHICDPKPPPLRSRPVLRGAFASSAAPSSLILIGRRAKFPRSLAAAAAYVIPLPCRHRPLWLAAASLG